MLGSFATEVTNEVKKNRFSRGKVCPHCGHDEVSRNGKYKENKDISASSAERLLPTLHSLQSIKSKNLLVQSHTSHTDTKLKDFRIREVIYI